MNKLLLLALLGLILGAGVWKTQNPDATLEDFKAQSFSSFERLKSGVESGVGTIASYPQSATSSANLETRLQQIEEQLNSIQSDGIAASDEMSLNQGAITENLDALTEQYGSLVERVNNISSDNATDSADTNSDVTASPSVAEQTLVADLAALTDSINSRFGEIENRLGDAASDSQLINQVNTQLSAAEEKIAALEQQLALAAESPEEPDNTPATSQPTGAGTVPIANTQEQIRQELDQVQAQLNNADELVSTREIESLLNTTRFRLNALEPFVQQLPASSARSAFATQSQRDLYSQVTDLQEQLAALPNTARDLTLQQTQGSQSDTIEYKIYFERNSSEITVDASAVLNSFIVQEQNRTTGVSIFGFTDRRGAPEYNQQLALNRASNVRTYLINNGLDIDLIKNINSSGEDAVINSIPDETPDAEQRVVVLLAAQPNQP